MPMNLTEGNMLHRLALPLIIGVTTFLALTGCVGLLPTRVAQLGECSDYCFGRLAVVGIVGAMLAIYAAASAVVGASRMALASAGLAVGLLLSGVVNWCVDQDPLGAWLNWRAPYLEYDPCWRDVGIENHEQIYFEPELNFYCGGGAGIEVPDVVQHHWNSKAPQN